MSERAKLRLRLLAAMIAVVAVDLARTVLS
jgi:hypothetical protein